MAKNILLLTIFFTTEVYRRVRITSRQAYIAEGTASYFTLPMQKSFVKISGATVNCLICTRYYKSIHYSIMG